MAKFCGFLVSIATAVGAVSAGNGGGVPTAVTIAPTVAPNASLPAVVPTDTPTSASNTTPTVEDTCVLANFETATADFIALGNLVNIVKTSPAVLKQYVSDPMLIQNQTLATQNISFLGYTFETTPTINWLNVSGITTISPLPVNVTGVNTLELGTDFTGTIALEGTLTVEVAMPDHKWYQICWVDLLHPIKCRPQIITVDVALAVSKPHIVTNIEANLFECAPGIPTSTCQNLTMASIMTGALSGDLTTLTKSIYKNFRDAKVNTLSLGWDLITNIDFVFHNSGQFVTQIINGLLDFSAKKLNKKGDYYRVFLDVSQKLMLSLLNKIIDTQLEPAFGATCL
ncbi:hypothetical protein F444_04685 [Phytophthora nicotianae P1976]|uniref:Lipid-binding serum glycoprotein N-terminal domain-containing protein n=1 Tax=Phytophthora nicotianae P1976 TaxID=1317066 RepID=A0A081APU4_PHYNI|nr:hypothetical protein F444_04685 [Phytophthora nicotianae P1976]